MLRDIIIAIILIIFVIFLYNSIFTRDTPSEINAFRGIYLDNNSTTQPTHSVQEIMQKYAFCGNHSSSYTHEAQNKVRAAEQQICDWVGYPAKIIWTSGGSEANNLFLRGIVDAYHMHTHARGTDTFIIQKPHIICSMVEHKSSIDCVKQLEALNRADVTWIPPRCDGSIHPMEVAYAITPATIAISIMHVNNETGAVNDINTIAQIAHSRGIPFHTDAVQSFGKYPRIMADAISVSFHKLHGPTGIGALILENKFFHAPRGISPQICGTQNYGLRGGTLNVAGIAGASEAMRCTFANRAAKNAHLITMRDFIIRELSQYFPAGDICKYYTAAPLDNNYVPARSEFVIMNRDNLNTLALCFIKNSLARHFCNLQLKRDLEVRGVKVSIGSACSHNSKSHVLVAMKMPFVIQCGIIRVSLGDNNTLDECEYFCRILIPLVAQQFAKN